jgi:hypothetical protein
MLYRIQDREGRGPFKPGFTMTWISDRDSERYRMGSIFEELGLPPGDLHRLIPFGVHAGCACVSEEQLRRWFTREEMRRLKRAGYGVCEFEPDIIIAETATQVLFGMKSPLSELWSAAA